MMRDGIDAALDQRLGDDAGAGAELDDRKRPLRVDMARHLLRQRRP